MPQIFKGKQLIAFEWAMTALSLALVSLRIYSRGYNRKLRLLSNNTRRLRISDLFVVMAWLSFVAQTSMDTVLYHRGFFLPKYENDDLVNLADTVMLKLYFIESGSYLITMYCVKAAMLCLFHEFFPKLRIVSKKRSWIALCIVDVLVLGCFISGQVGMFTACWPVWKNWTLDPNEFCTPTSLPIMAWYWGSHVATDIIIYLLPISVIRSMNLSHQDKVGMTSIFALGFLCILFAVGTIASSYKVQTFSDQWAFTVFEQTWAIAIVCLPAIRSLWISRHVCPQHLGSTSPGNSAEAAANGSYVPTYTSYVCDVEATKGSVKGGTGRGRQCTDDGVISPVGGEHIRLASCGGSVFSECSATRDCKELEAGMDAVAICNDKSSGENERWWRNVKHTLDKARR